MTANEEKYVLAIDAGTTGVKAGVFTPQGVRLSIGSRENTTISPETGWNEQDMDRVWDLVRHAVGDALAPVDCNRVSAIAVTGQGDGLWALDGKFEPVRNAILWNDQRAGDIVQQWQQQGLIEEIAKFCGTAVWPGSSAPLLYWLKDNEPDCYRKIAHLCCCKDWIGYKLTGVLATDYTDATIPFLDLQSRQYSQSLVEKCGLPEIADRHAEPRPSHKLLGSLTETMQAEFGLSNSVPVAVGALDVAAMHVGAGINEVGQSLIILGTTAVVSTVVAPHALDGAPVGATVMHPATDRWLNVQAPQSGASAIDWFAGQHREKWPKGAEDVTRAAADALPGSNDLIFLPFLTGERAPFVAPAATGGFCGLTPTTEPQDMARSVLEGVAFSLRHCIEASGAAMGDKVLVTGGGANSSLWMQILADILNTRICTSRESELGLTGAALLANGLVTGSDPYNFTNSESTKDEFKPEARNREACDVAYRKYRSIIEQMMPLWC